MDCSTVGGQADFCRKTCKTCGAARKKRGDDITVVDSDDCYDEIATCAARIENGTLDCTKSGVQDFCRKSCKSCGVARKKRGDDITVVDSDDCYDEHANCKALIGNGGIDCSKSGGQEFCKASCKAC